MKTPPYRIQTERLIIRCYNPSDAPLLQESVAESRSHLLPWMPWAEGDPAETLDAKINRLRRFRANFDSDKDYTYGIFDLQEKQLLGGSGLHTRLSGEALEIGYWIHVDHVNKGYATELSTALTRVAFEVCAVERMEIHCSADNLRSASVPRKLGYVHEGNRRRLGWTAGQPVDSMVWSMFRDEYESSSCKDIRLQAFDAIGLQIL
jgi:RimJ/RimL family protein N-acetyltransferase